MEGTIAVSKAEQFRWRVIDDYREGRVGRREAATLLNVSEKTVQRLAKRCREKGLAGIKHGNLQRKPKNATADEIRSLCLELASKTYYDFNITHCLEMLRNRHGIEVSYSVFRRWCVAEGVGKRKRRRPSKARVYRERMGNEGLLLQMDGSHHKWNGSDEWVLIAAIDDATSEIAHAQMFRAEDTINCMAVLRRIIEIKGIPEALYVDRAGWFGGIKRQYFSQFVRACDELEIRVIYANSPQAKGRIERTWRTFQDRLIPELRLHEIKALGAANEYIQKQFIPNYWEKQNTVMPRHEQSRYRRLDPQENLDNIFCMKHLRKVRNDQTIFYDNILYKITGGIVGTLRGKEITLIERPNGPLQAFYGHLPLELKAMPRLGKGWVKSENRKRPA
jgi:transposase